MKDGCVIILKEKGSKLEWMTDAQFTEKDGVTKANILSASEDKVLFNMQNCIYYGQGVAGKS